MNIKKILLFGVIILMLFGIGLGVSFMIGENLGDPIVEVIKYDRVYTSKADVIAYRIFSATGIIGTWTIAILLGNFAIKEIKDY